MDEGESDLINFALTPSFRLKFRDRFGDFLLLTEVAVVELQEDPLGPADVIWVGGVNLAVPIVGEAEALELCFEVLGVRLSGDAGVGASLDGVLLCGKAECVPAHGVEDVETVHALVAADDVSGGVTLWVADVEAGAGGVREHVEDVVFRLRRVEVSITGVRGAVGFFAGPEVLPFLLELIEGEGLVL